MKSFWIALAIWAGLAAATFAQSIGGMSGIGIVVGKSSGGGGQPACGTGVIDLSTGCTLPIALGLVP